MFKARIERWNQVYQPNAAMLRFTLVQQGYRVYQWGDMPEMVFPVHKKDMEISHWIVSGSLEVTVEGFGTYTLEMGDRDFLAAHVWHSARVVSEEAVIYLIGEKIT